MNRRAAVGWLIIAGLFAAGCSPHKRVPYELTVEYYAERFDSKAGTLTRLHGSRESARVDLTPAERDTLWDLLARSGYFEAPSKVGKGSKGVEFRTLRIEVVTDTDRHALTWNPTLPELAGVNPPWGSRRLDPQEKGLREFVERLHAMLQRRATVRALPRLIGF